MITGGVKTTPVLAMQLLCDLQPFTNIIEKNAAILFNRLIRLPNNSFWRDYDSDGGRNLKTQKGFIQCVRENIQYKVINDVPFELLSFANPLDYAILDIRLDLVLNVRKRDLSPTALHAIALETINTRFPPEDHLFSFYLHAGPLTTHFDGEVEAIHIALQQLAVHLPPIERAVILSDSTSALQALSNYNENNCLRVQNYRELLGKIKGKIVFQWVPSHCGLWGNERADFLAKKRTGILQNFRRDLTLHSAKLKIKRIFRESFRLTASRVACDKPWSTLCKKSHGIPSSPRAAAVVKFRLLTGHDCLCAHLFRFNLVTSPICVLCDTGQDMTAAYLDECSALNDLNCIVKSNHNATFQEMKVCAAIQRDACPDHKVSAAEIIDFSDIGGQVMGPWFSPYENFYVQAMAIYAGKIFEKRKTSRRSTSQFPVFKEMLMFDVPFSKLDHVVLLLAVFSTAPQASPSIVRKYN
ncbi:uncharacterized protein LOC103524116 [Trichonephila clavipes]|nr:uncharacterized protein LOC103524116 [Trichonephila clavipes]